MLSLKEHLKKGEIIVDGHVHCIGGSYVGRTGDVQVCALNDWPDNPRKSNYPEYESFFRSSPDDLVIGVGADKGEMIAMLSDDRFDGYGEIISHKNLDDGSVYDSGLLDIALDGTRKPVYVHWDLDSTSSELERKIDENGKSKIVLCHCGMNRNIDNEVAFKLFKKLINNHSNLWGDISWSAMDVFLDDISKLDELPRDRIICGTDNSDRDSEKALKSRIEKLKVLNRYIDNRNNINRLFNEKF